MSNAENNPQSGQPQPGFGGANQPQPGPSGENQPPAGFGGTNQPPAGFGGTNQPPAGFGGTNQPPAGFGGTNQPPAGFGGTNQPPAGFGDPNQPPPVFGEQDQAPAKKPKSLVMRIVSTIGIVILIIGFRVGWRMFNQQQEAAQVDAEATELSITAKRHEDSIFDGEQLGFSGYLDDGEKGHLEGEPGSYYSFGFKLKANETVAINAKSVNPVKKADSAIEIHNSNGEFIAANDDISENNVDSHITYTAKQDETIYITVMVFPEAPGEVTVTADIE